MTFDVVLRNGRVVDPARAIDAVLDVGFADRKVAALGPRLEGRIEQDVPAASSRRG